MTLVPATQVTFGTDYRISGNQIARCAALACRPIIAGDREWQRHRLAAAPEGVSRSI